MSAYATDNDLTLRIPELKCLSFAARRTALADAECFVSLSAYGSFATQAHVLYAAHLLACRYPEDLGGEQGPVTSLKAGEIASSYAATAPSENSVGTTKWGRMFMQVCNSIVAPYVVG